MNDALWALPRGNSWLIGGKDAGWCLMEMVIATQLTPDASATLFAGNGLSTCGAVRMLLTGTIATPTASSRALRVRWKSVTDMTDLSNGSEET